MNISQFFLGIFLLQFFYISYQYILFKRIEYVYYLIYFTIVSGVILLKVYPDSNPFRLFVIPDQPFTAGRGLLLIGVAYYFKFGRYFTDTPALYKKLNNKLVFAEWLLILFGSFDVLTQILRIDYFVIDAYSKWVYISLIPFSFYVIIFLLTRGKILINILVIGSSLLFIFGMLGFFIAQISGHRLPEYKNSFYTQIGVILELLFLNFGLIYKTWMIQKEYLRMEVAKQMELNRQRMEISSDLHDEIGATLSGIALYSHLAGDQVAADQKSGLQNSIAAIRKSAADMVNKLNDIIWAVNPVHDNLGEMMEHLEEYLLQMAAAKEIESTVDFDKRLKDLPVDMNIRKEIYLICKEAVNNGVKYSGCSKLNLKADVSGDMISFIIEDNGKGFNLLEAGRGNGLKNMQARAAVIGSRLHIQTAPGKGTKIFFSVVNSAK